MGGGLGKNSKPAASEPEAGSVTAPSDSSKSKGLENSKRNSHSKAELNKEQTNLDKTVVEAGSQAASEAETASGQETQIQDSHHTAREMAEKPHPTSAASASEGRDKQCGNTAHRIGSDQQEEVEDGGRAAQTAWEDLIRHLEEKLKAAEERADKESQRAEEEAMRAEEERKRAEEEAMRAEHERQRAEEAQAEVTRLAARIAELEEAADRQALALEEATSQLTRESSAARLLDRPPSSAADMSRQSSSASLKASPSNQTPTEDGEVIWFCDLDGELKFYDPVDCAALEKAYALLRSRSSNAPSRTTSSARQSKTASATVEVRRGRNMVDVSRMVQVNKQTGKERPVQRKEGQPPRPPSATAAAFQKRIPTMQVQKDFAGIVNGMRTYPNHLGVQEAACKAIVSLASINDQAKAKIAAEGGVESVLEAMRTHAGQPTLLEPACRALRRLAHSASLGAMQNQTLIAERGGVEVVVAALHAMAEHAAVQYEGLAVLRILATEATRVRRRVVDAGGIDAALAAMLRHAASAQVQAQGCGVLRFVAAAGSGADEKLAQSVRVEIAAKGGVERVKAARGAAGATEEAKKWGRQVLDFCSSAAAEEAASRRREEERMAAARRSAEEGCCRPLCLLLRARRPASSPAHAADDGGSPQGQGGAAGGGGEGEEGAEHKYTARKLILKASTVAAAGLRPAIGLEDDRVLGNLMQDPEAAIEVEFLEHGSQEDLENFEYIYRGTAGAWGDLPTHVKRDIEIGRYHGGELGADDYDAGHKGMTLDDFVALPVSQLAKLRRHHVLVLRLYTSSTFARFNRPLRRISADPAAAGQRQRHPFRFSVLVLAEALKMLRVVGAEMDPEGFNQVRWLYRGMADMEVDIAGRFLAEGGTELALMSTTDKPEVALNYARSRRPLIFKYKTLGLTRGCSIRFLSLYPKEDEFLYPPLTFISAEGALYVEEGITYLDVVPQMS